MSVDLDTLLQSMTSKTKLLKPLDEVLTPLKGEACSPPSSAKKDKLRPI
jgi:hypothetical protein